MKKKSFDKHFIYPKNKLSEWFANWFVEGKPSVTSFEVHTITFTFNEKKKKRRRGEKT